MGYLYVYKNGSKMQINDFELDYWNSQGWTDGSKNPDGSVNYGNYNSLYSPSAEAVEEPAPKPTSGGSKAGAEGEEWKFTGSPDMFITAGEKVLNPDSGAKYIVKFTSDPTPGDGIDDTAGIWEFDPSTSTYRRFLNLESIAARYADAIGMQPGEDVNAAVGRFLGKNLYSVDPAVIEDTNSFFAGQFLDKSYAIQSDGSAADYQTDGNTANATNFGYSYGSPRASLNDEANAANAIGAIFTTALKTGQLSEDIYNRFVMNNEGGVMSKYLGAWLYGGYNFDALWRDLKAKELYEAGDQNYANYKGFDDQIPASQWYATPEGKKAMADPALTPPTDQMGIHESVFSLPLFQISGDLFKTIIPPIDRNSAEFKEEADQIMAAWYDIAEAKLNAETEQQKAQADYDWDVFKKNLNRKYNIQLSDSAFEAWKQLESLFESSAEGNTYGSGLFNEARDQYLASVRRNDERLRESKMTDMESEERSRLLKSGDPDDIREAVERMNAEDSAAGLTPDSYRSVRWGLTPDPNELLDVRYPDGTTGKISVPEYFSFDNLKRMYPDMDDDSIRNFASSMVDQYGNFRSDLYKTMYENKYNLSEGKTTYQQDKLYQQKLDEEKRAYAPFTGGNPFVNYQKSRTDVYQPPTSATKAAESVSRKYFKAPDPVMGDTTNYFEVTPTGPKYIAPDVWKSDWGGGTAPGIGEETNVPYPKNWTLDREGKFAKL